MKILLDRTVCNCWEAACESDFADKYLGENVQPTACTLLIQDEDERDEILFLIKDRDGTEKEFIVNDRNLNLAMDSWIQAYKKQQAEKAQV
jgi:hypothetical protein